MIKKFNNIGLNFDNSYSRLPKILMTKVNPTPVMSPKIIFFNKELAQQLNLDLITNTKLASLFSGNYLPQDSNCISQAYAGHQFGHFTMLGDGRAILLGEHINLKKQRFDIQLKGAGITPYSRNGDGRATLISMLREYLMSETLYGLNIPTTRSLAIVSTGESVQRENVFMGGILTRVASSHIRVGTFQYLSMRGDLDTLNKLINYSLKRHYAENQVEINPSITLLKCVIKTQISLIVDWMRVGFIHGVMNTDNMSISGETIDYGPCAFMNSYNPNTVYSSIDHRGRYSFINQPIIAHWNISRFAETLIPFLHNSEKKALEIGKEIIDSFEKIFKDKWLEMMKKKLGFIKYKKNDIKIIQNLLDWMNDHKADYTNTFIYLMDNKKINDKIYENNSFKAIHKRINDRLKEEDIPIEIRNTLIKSNNPIVIPRNHMVEESLNKINDNKDYSLYNELLDTIKDPYLERENTKKFQNTPTHSFETNYKTFCGT